MKSCRTYILLVAILFLRNAYAWQLTKEHNLPRGGDKLDIILYEDVTPGPSGENINWDFSQSNVSTQSSILSYSGNENELITARFSKYRLYYTLRNDSLLWHGYEDRTMSLIDSVGALALKFPVSYGDSCSFSFDMRGRYYLEHKATEIGIGYIKVDGKGSIILPDGDTITNVLRVCRVYKGSPAINLNSLHTKPRAQNTPQEAEYREYDWYAYGYRYPVFSVRETYICEDSRSRVLNSFAYVCSPHSQEIDINNDTANELIRQETSSDTGDMSISEKPSLSNLSFADNGSQLSLRFDYSGNNNTMELIVSDSFGISHISISQTPIHQGYNEINIPVYDLQKGEYALLLILNGERIPLKFQHR